MWNEFLIILVWGGIVALDTTAVFQVLISQPLVSCTIVGLLLGNPTVGIIIGIVMELPWLLEITAGGARFSESNLGSVTAASIAIIAIQVTHRQEISFLLALLTGVLISYLGGKLVIWQRKKNDLIMNHIDSFEVPNSRQVWQHHYFSILLTFISGGVFVAVLSVAVGKWLLPVIIENVPQHIDPVFKPVKSVFLGVGVGAMLVHFYQKKNFIMILFGVLLGLIIVILQIQK